MKTRLTGDSNKFLNINGLKLTIKRNRLTDWIQKQNPSFCCKQETHLNLKNRHCLRGKGWENFFQSNGPMKQVGVDRLQAKINQKRQRRTYHISHRKHLSKGNLNTEHV